MMTAVATHKVTTTIASPIGPLTLVGVDGRLIKLSMHEQRYADPLDPECERDDSAFTDVVSQLDAYFAGKLKKFEVDFSFEGTQFQCKAWNELYKIPYGETISYGEQAARLGNPKASRAVGAANGRNPIAIIVPCHRVIGADKTLTGFGGGLERKDWLLKHELSHS
jgi:methylated-DNA-[protein]-cysteine S-methyltransferase